MEIIKRSPVCYKLSKQQIVWLKSYSHCPICGLPKSEWTRRTDWRCCSVECTDKLSKLTYVWQYFKFKALERDHYTCVKCGDNKKEVEVESTIKRAVNIQELIDGKEEKFRYEKRTITNVRNNFIVDHIIPISIGGQEYDLENIQTLCLKCNKIKTKKDMQKIALFRKQHKSQEVLP